VFRQVMIYYRLTANTRYPGQENIGGDSKIPSVLYYNTSGNARAIGAETQRTHVIERAEAEGWMKLELYVLASASTIRIRVIDYVNT